MKKHPNIETHQIYRKSEETNHYLIEVALDKYEDIFNEWDPAPFKRRDLHPNLTEFFEECSSEINIRYQVAVVFYLPKAEIDLEKQEQCIRGLRNHFAYSVHTLRKRLKVSRQRAIRNILVGIAFLFVATTAEASYTRTLLSSVLVQGLFIGGWVFVWEGISSVMFKDHSTRTKAKEWERLHDAPIAFKKEHKPGHNYER